MAGIGPSNLLDRHERRRVLAACFTGTTIEWYDFFLYGSAAALIFAPQFFPSLSPFAGSLAAFATFAVGFIARPIGAIILAHYGDRYGRKSVLVASLMIMGLATVGIGLLPPYESIGVFAPIALVALRFLQGIGVGGEWGGAAMLAVEHAPANRRGFYGAFPQMGVPAGLVLANAALLAVTASLPANEFEAWGWRIPFLASVVLIGIGMFIRLKVVESPVFAAAAQRSELVRHPTLLVLRRHGKGIALAGGTFIAGNALGYLYMVYVLSYGSRVLELDRVVLLVAILAGAVLQLVLLPVFGALSDRIGRRLVYTWGTAACLLWSFAFFPLIDMRSSAGVAVAVVVMAGLLAPTFAAQSALFAELFPTPVRYSGSSLAYQMGAVLGGGLAPMVATALHGSGGSSVLVIAYMVGLCVVSLGCVLAIAETSGRTLTAPANIAEAPASGGAQ
ncbi:MFS transporter [Sinosporangium siamense]|uniref:Putative proline/betaine transporter n=1 Tax=Sinosporangium siamense TaxID=1367973 RepID=A0A919VFV4_9ACTN|nr:MFS transporter [Sinosporangium siamense]GII96484.1 MFS transporter [Sinosporangium siamense]